MRGKVYCDDLVSGIEGITPAYAGKSALHLLKVQGFWDHPRVCGEKIFQLSFWLML